MRITTAIVALLAMAHPASAQQAVYTNIVDGQRVDIVKVTRAAKPAAALPPSLAEGTVLPAGWTPERGGTYYVPPVPSSMAATQPRPERPVQPWLVNGIYAGPSPSGNWMATSVGRPIVDVRIVGGRSAR